MTGLVIGNYRITDRLGHGGQGKVYRAIDTMVEREVAIKALRPEIARDPETLERFRTEAVTLAKLNHSSVAQLYTFFREGEEFFMVMEYVPGRTLEAMIQEDGAIPWQRAVAIAISILDGVGFAHSMGILHRDLKPANIMVTQDGRVKVMDFGIAQVLGGRKLTREGRIVGTVEYLAPERIRGNPPDERSDLYSLGIVLYEMLTGKLPLNASSEYSMMMAQLNERPPLPKDLGVDLPEPLVQIVMKALEKEPARRFSDASSFAEALRSIPRSTTAPVAPPPVLFKRQLPLKWIAVAAGVFALVVLISLLVFKRTEEDPWKEARSLAPTDAPVAPPVQQPPSSSQPQIAFDPTPIPMPAPAQPAEVTTIKPEPVKPPVVQPKAAAPPVRVPAVPEGLTAEQRRAVVAALDRTDGPAGGDPGSHPIHLVGLLGALTAGGKPAVPEIERAVVVRGVNFQVTPAISRNLADAGASPSLIRSAVDYFRPSAPSPEPVSIAREQVPPSQPVRAITSIRDVRRIFVERTEGELDNYIRDELRDHLGDRIKVATAAAQADAVMQISVEQLKGGKLSRAGRMFGLSDKRRVQARVLDASTRKVLWEDKAGDRQLVTGSFVGDGVKRMASRIVTALQEDLNN